MGSAFQRESIFAGSNTAVQCMQECSTFTINFKTFATALGTHASSMLARSLHTPPLCYKKLQCAVIS